jgi:cation:H+ antiporter
VLLVGGAELFVDSAAGAARRLGLTVVALGLLLAGAEPEELVTAMYASARGHPGLAAGDAIGANVTMLTLALGLAAAFAPLPVGRRVRRYAIAAAAAGGLAVLALLDGQVSRVEGAVLVGAYVAGVALVWRMEKAPPVVGELAEIEGCTDSEGYGLPGLLIGLVLMAGGGVVAVAGATRVVQGLGRGDDAIGLTLLALATTAELFALVFAAARRGATEVAVAGVVGSAAYNGTATLGAAAMVHPLAGVHMVRPAVVAAVLPVTVVLLALRGGRLSRPAGVALVAGYLLFAGHTLR